MIPVVEARQIHTDGTAGNTTIDVTTDLLAGLSPFVASVQAYTVTENRSANMRWKVQFQGTNTGRSYNAATDLFAFLAANAETTQTAYTAVENLGLRARYALVCSPSAGTAIESAVVWVYLAMRLRS